MNLSYTIFTDREMTEIRDVANLEGMAADKAMECIRHALGGRYPKAGEVVADLGIRVDAIDGDDVVILIFQPPGDRPTEVYGPFPDGKKATSWGSKALAGLPTSSWFWLPINDPEADEFVGIPVRHANLDF